MKVIVLLALVTATTAIDKRASAAGEQASRRASEQSARILEGIGEDNKAMLEKYGQVLDLVITRLQGLENENANIKAELNKTRGLSAAANISKPKDAEPTATKACMKDAEVYDCVGAFPMHMRMQSRQQLVGTPSREDDAS